MDETFKAAFNKAQTEHEQISVLFKEVMRLQSVYEAQKSMTENNALWLEAHRRLAREKGCDDLERLLEILDEIEAEK